MNLEHLYYFRTLARLEHYTKASEELHISQSSLSYAISSLEKELDCRLFQKEGRGVCLTACGQIYQGYVEQALRLLDAGKAEVSAQRDENKTISIVLTRAFASTTFIPNLLTSFQSNQSKVIGQEDTQFNFITVTSSSEGIRFLQEQKAHFCFCLAFPDAPDLTQVKVLDRKTVLAIPKDSPLNCKKEILLADLVPYKVYIVGPDSKIARALEKACQKQGLTLDIRYVSHGFVTASAVSNGEGVGIIVNDVYLKDMNFCVRSLSDYQVDLSLYCTYVPIILENRTLKRFLDHIVKNYKIK